MEEITIVSGGYKATYNRGSHLIVDFVVYLSILDGVYRTCPNNDGQLIHGMSFVLVGMLERYVGRN